MPSKSKKQEKLMRAAAHNKEFADKVGIDQKVAREWMEADQKAKKKQEKKSFKDFFKGNLSLKELLKKIGL